MAVKFSNYSSTVLAAPLIPSQTQITVASATGFPPSLPGFVPGVDWFYATLIDQPSYALQAIPPAQIEIVKVTAASGNVFTVIRGLDGTTAQTWATGSILEVRVNAAGLGDIPTSTGTLSYTSPSAGGVPRTLVSKLSDIVSVKDFGAVGDGTTDDTLAIQAALNTGAGQIYFPKARYRITSTVSYLSGDRSVIEGNGSNLFLDEGSGTLDVFKLGNGGGSPFGVVVRNLLVTRAQVATAGAGFRLDHCAGCKFEGCEVAGGNAMFFGFSLFRAVDTWILNCEVQGAVSHGISQSGTDLTGNENNSRIFDCQIQHNGGNGINTGDFNDGGSYFRNTIYANGGAGISLSASTGANAGGDYEISENNIDSNTSIGVLINQYGNVRLNNNWVSNNGGVQVSSPASAQLVMSGNLIFGGSAASVDLSAMTNALITGNMIYGGTSGVLLRSGASVVTISGNVIRQSTGWAIDTSAGPNFVTVTGNTYASNTSGNLRTGATNLVQTGNNP